MTHPMYVIVNGGPSDSSVCVSLVLSPQNGVWSLSLETGVLACPLNTFHCEPAVPAPRPAKMAFIHVSTVFEGKVGLNSVFITTLLFALSPESLGILTAVSSSTQPKGQIWTPSYFFLSRVHKSTNALPPSPVAHLF